ncbi:retrotransposon protein [Cucumis melo var. makuwa]|uniref:Retrotransposon protein n=1 Tax=Cucumis melo var. makuwa TaxID=1194695 RepID=A0A5A7VJK9_CUCMM|nr:retrotransposon protein [Cucumis melo var. makuwa]TYK20283.1 retrotransposon protein [Cucumis melo var. makuwa]
MDKGVVKLERERERQRRQEIGALYMTIRTLLSLEFIKVICGIVHRERDKWREKKRKKKDQELIGDDMGLLAVDLLTEKKGGGDEKNGVKNCLGALNGTYIKVSASKSERPRYRTRKGEVVTNALGVCDMKGDFVYVLTGWEGSAVDSRYPNAEGFLTPYKGQHYHLQEWHGAENAPSSSKEFFNIKHSFAHNVIKRTFGVLKSRWAILQGKLYYPAEVQCRTILACCLLYNLTNREMTNYDISKDIDKVDSTHATTVGDDIHFIETSNEWKWQIHRDYLSTVGRKRKSQASSISKCWWCRSENETFRPGHPAAKGLLNKSFPQYDELSYVFGKVHATGAQAKTFVDVGSNDPASQGLNMLPDELMGTRTAPISEGRYVSSGFKRQHGEQALESGEVIYTAIEYENEQLSCIAEWPVLQCQNASQTRQEVVQQLEVIPELTLMDRCRLMRILMRNMDDMKAFFDVLDNMKYLYCNIILEEN